MATGQLFWRRLQGRLLAASAVICMVALATSSAHAKQVLYVSPLASTTINATAATGGGFIVANTEIQPTGTGVINPFLTIQQTGQERGFNTDIGEPYDSKRSGGGFTRSVTVGELGTVTQGGIEYIQFLLDVNQQANGNISLNQVQIFLSSVDLGGVTNSLTEATQGTGANGTGGNDALISFGANATEIFRMNNLQNTSGNLSTNKEIWIDSSHGSGSGDMFLYVQSSLFGLDLTKYVTLFSQFGRPNGTYDSNAGFEEWAVRQGTGPTPGPVVPEPATVVMGLMGFGALGFVQLRRRRRTAATAS